MRQMMFLIAASLISIMGCSSGDDANKNKTEKNKADTGKTDKDKSDDGKLYPPCHPGCFPAGSLVSTPEGLRPIETIRTGERVMLIDPDGFAKAGEVHSVFQTCNKLVEVQTEAGNIRTTSTQPLCLEQGEFLTAGELVRGQRIWHWDGSKRSAVRVKSVVSTEEEAGVFNLVVGDSAIFVVNGFLAKGKPPLSP